MKKIKLDIYAGMRNAGKTSVIQKMLSELYAGCSVSVIQNETGRASLAPAGSNIHIHTLTSGCICCSGGVFTSALEQLSRSEDPEYIILEPSGTADLKTLESICLSSGIVHLNRCIYISRASSASKLLKIKSDFFIDQLRCADSVYLNFADDLNSAALQDTCSQIRAANPPAEIITASLESLNAVSFREAQRELALSEPFSADTSVKPAKILARSRLNSF